MDQDLTVKLSKKHAFAAFRRAGDSLSLPELSDEIAGAVPERTPRRWLTKWVDEGELVKGGNRRSTRYRLADVSVAPELRVNIDTNDNAAIG